MEKEEGKGRKGEGGRRKVERESEENDCKERKKEEGEK